MWLLNKLLRTKQHYAAGALKAILARAVTTAVGFCRAKACSSSACPFCDLNVDEETRHIFKVCPAWESIRASHQFASHARLPQCARMTGVIGFEPATLAATRALDAPDPLAEDSCVCNTSDTALEFHRQGRVVVYTDGSCLSQNCSLWRRAGFGVVYDAEMKHSLTVSRPLLGLEQTAQRAELRAFLCVIQRDPRPLLVHTDSAYVVDVWSKFKEGRSLVRDGDNLDICHAIFRNLAAREASVEVVKVAGHGGGPLNDAADSAAKAGAHAHHTPQLLRARQAYWSLRNMVVKRQRTMLAIVLERCRVAKARGFLTFAENGKDTQALLRYLGLPIISFILRTFKVIVCSFLL